MFSSLSFLINLNCYRTWYLKVMSFDFSKMFSNSESTTPIDAYDAKLVKDVQNEVKNIIDRESGRERLEGFWRKKY
jgi:hypothetical protein